MTAIFQKVILSSSDSLSEQEKRLYACLRFVADQVVPACFYFNEDWSKRDVLKAVGIELAILTDKQRATLNSHGLLPKEPTPNNMPSIVYISHEDWNMRMREKQQVPVSVPKDEFIFSNSPAVHRASLELQGLNANTAILCLAAAGLDIILPNVSFNLLASQEIEEIKSELQEERNEYLSAISAIADGSYERITSQDFSDLLRWARNEAHLKLVPKARNIERDVTKLKKSTLRQAGFSFFKEGVPSIGRAYIESGSIAASKVAGEEILNLIVHLLSREAEARHLPEVAYAIKIKKSMKY